MDFQLKYGFCLKTPKLRIWDRNWPKLQSAKILLLPSKYELIMVPANHSCFQYCDSNIRLFFIAPCEVITLNPLCIVLVSVLCFFFDGSFSKVITLPTIAKAIVVALSRS